MERAHVSDAGVGIRKNQPRSTRSTRRTTELGGAAPCHPIAGRISGNDRPAPHAARFTARLRDPPWFFVPSVVESFFRQPHIKRWKARARPWRKLPSLRVDSVVLARNRRNLTVEEASTQQIEHRWPIERLLAHESRMTGQSVIDTTPSNTVTLPPTQGGNLVPLRSTTPMRLTSPVAPIIPPAPRAGTVRQGRAEHHG
jgi:hypothetical protein